MTTSTSSIPGTFAPRLAPDASIHRHSYRGTPWYLVHDSMTGRSLHLAEGAWRVVGAMDGRRSIDDIHTHLNTANTTTDVDQVRAVCAQLLRAGLLDGVAHDNAGEQAAPQRPARWRQWLASPLSVRLPLVNPEAWLDRYAQAVKPLFSAASFWLWASIIVTACALAVSQQAALMGRVTSTAISPYGVALFLGVYIVMKSLHELAHALSIRVFGGRVSEMGLMLLVFIPVPYVDASSATTFASKRHRMIVSSAGIMTEALISALALFAWVNIEAGIVREICFAAVMIGSVSTLLFNGNPLLRFDGYYVLSDALEIPNLAVRSRRYVGYLLQRYVLRLPDACSPVVTSSERLWFVLYGVLSSVYRLIIMGVIVWFVSRQVPLLGYALAGWVLLSQLALPALRSVAALIARARSLPNTNQVLTRLATTAAALSVCVFVLPMPAWSSAEGVVWMAPDAQIKAPVDGFVEPAFLPNAIRVDEHQPVLRLHNARVLTEARVIERQLDEVNARHNLALFRDRSRLKGITEQMIAAQERLLDARQQIADMIVASPTPGALHYFEQRALAGRYVNKGDVLAYVRDDSAPVLRVVVRQTQIERLRDPGTSVRVLIPGHLDQPFAAALHSELGATTHKLPSAALGSAGGGRIATEATNADQRTATEEVFVVDVQLPAEAPAVAVGTRVYLRFDYTPQPLMQQMLTALRQLTLGTNRA